MRRGRSAPSRRIAAGALKVLLLPLLAVFVFDRPSLADPATASASPDATRSSARVTLERETVLMGTRLRSRVTAPTRETAIREIERVFRIVDRTERLLSTWTRDSELAGVNAAPVGRPTRVSDRLFELLLEVRAWSRRTEGVLDPAVGSLVDAWDLRGAGRRPSPEERERARAAAGPDCFAFDRRVRTVERRCQGGWIDAGAFGKGEALRRAGRALREGPVASALIDFGGQVLAVGVPAAEPEAGDPGWRVGVSHPDRRDLPAVLLRLRDRSAATSSLSERFVEVDGERYGHVLDPRDGAPAPDWGSVTVVARDPLVADLLSTALYVMGPSRGPAWASEREIAALFLRSSRSGLSQRTRSPPSGCFTEAMRPHLADEDVKTERESESEIERDSDVEIGRTDPRVKPEPKENRPPMEIETCT